MNPSCLEFALTDTEAAAFERDGFLIVEDALSAEQVGELSELLDGLVADGGFTHTPHPSRDGRVNAIDIAGQHPSLIELVDNPRTLPKVWEILGWNMHLYHSHYIMAPQIPRPANGEAEATLGWHQDSGRINQDVETNPRPRLSLKVGYFLSDASEAERGNFWVLPGSHLRNEIERPASGRGQPEGAMPGVRVSWDCRVFRSPALARRVAELLTDRAQGALLRLFPPLGPRPRRGDGACRPVGGGRSHPPAVAGLCHEPARTHVAHRRGCSPARLAGTAPARHGGPLGPTAGYAQSGCSIDQRPRAARRIGHEPLLRLQPALAPDAVVAQLG